VRYAKSEPARVSATTTLRAPASVSKVPNVPIKGLATTQSDVSLGHACEKGAPVPASSALRSSELVPPITSSALLPPMSAADGPVWNSRSFTGLGKPARKLPEAAFQEAMKSWPPWYSGATTSRARTTPATGERNEATEEARRSGDERLGRVRSVEFVEHGHPRRVFRLGDDRGGALDRIQKEADRLNALVAELLQVTRAEGDPASLRREEVRLDELVRDIVETNRIEATARGCELKLDISAAARIQGEPELLRRAIENVVRNAIRYAPAGTVVEVMVRGNSIAVRDYGPGVPEGALARIFDPFYRVENDRDRSSGGVGLGLAIARRAVELHKGAITARNANPGLLVEITVRS